MIKIDEKVLKMAIQGDTHSFEQIIIDSQDYVWSYALRFLGDYHLAQDAVQDIFIKIYKGLPGFNHKSKFTTWLYRVTHNCCVDHYRKHKSKNESHLSDMEGVKENSVELSSSYLSEMLNRLKPESKQVFAMVTIFGFSYKETAEMIGCSMETIKSRLFRARQELIKILEIEDIEEATR